MTASSTSTVGAFDAPVIRILWTITGEACPTKVGVLVFHLISFFATPPDCDQTLLKMEFDKLLLRSQVQKIYKHRSGMGFVYQTMGKERNATSALYADSL